MELPLREQGTLLTVIRGCDVVPKEPLDSSARRLTAWLRFAIMVAADPREVDFEPGAFMVSLSPAFKPSEFGHLPQHWVAHVMHALEVIGYRHPDPNFSGPAWVAYRAFVRGLHLEPESRERMIERLSEDRIATGTVVS
jgi:hypothetical protein